jgi:hypothetical protein
VCIGWSGHVFSAVVGVLVIWTVIHWVETGAF